MNFAAFALHQFIQNHKEVTKMQRLFVILTLISLLLPSCTKASTTIPESSPTVAIPTRIQLGNYKLLAPEDMRADLNELFNSLEISHPNLYANRPKDGVDADRQKVFDDLNHPMTIFDYYLKVAPLIDSLGDMHTKVLPPYDINPAELLFPLNVKFFGQRAAITYNLSGNQAIPSKAELLSINGTAISALPRLISLYRANLFSFSSYLWYNFGSVPEYQVELLSAGEATPTVYQVHGMTIKEINAEAATSNQLLPKEFTYQTVTDSDIGVMTINTFDGGPGQYLQASFDQIKQDNVKHLIIDIRANEGGKYDQVDAVMAYLTSQPYRQCSRQYFRYVSEQDQPPRELECDLIQPPDRPSRFEGDIHLLIGPDTFSAAVTFATILQDFKLATLVGDETIDKASYCGAVSDPMVLSHTQLQYTYAKTCFVRPSGTLDNTGVIPDLIVKTTIDDYQADRDPVLAKAIDLIK
jgi:hypothetical protein